MFKSLFIVCVLLFSSLSRAGENTEPFDFAYSIEGKSSRILTVFNDAENTFIQVKEKSQMVLIGQSFTTRGIYYVVKGTPSRIEGSINGELFSVVWSGAKNVAIADENERHLGDFAERTMSGTYGRVVYLNGVPKEIGVINALPNNITIKEALKALAPHGWSGNADRSIDINQSVTILSQKGESWVIVLDRLMKSLNLWIEVDSAKGSLYLRDAPPKGFSVVLEEGAQNRKPFPITVGLIPFTEDYIPVVAEAGLDPMLRIVNIRNIDDNGGELKVGIINSSLKMTFQNLETGEVIKTRLNESDMSYKFPHVNLLMIQLEKGEAIEVKRIVKRLPQFSAFNKLGLTKVIETEKGTEFQFKSRLQTAMFSDGGREIYGGEWKGNTFTVAGHSSQWRVNSPSDAAWIDFEESSVYSWRKPISLTTARIPTL